MKIFKLSFSLFLLTILGLVVMTTATAQAKLGPVITQSVYHYFYPYFSVSKDISQVKPTDNVSTIRVPEASQYLKQFTKEIKSLNGDMQAAIKSFIADGVDDNTKKLGAGERAAVVSSYEAAFNKLPQTEAELTDAIKIANGRFPSAISASAEQKAKQQFYKVYNRVADLSDNKDAVAITVMAYGLRQQAQNRNLNSEKAGIQTFKKVFGQAPATTQDWNIMQAITYSGATRKTDSDKDGVADETEKKIGTNPNKADTDGDGYKDGLEILNNYSPLKK